MNCPKCNEKLDAHFATENPDDESLQPEKGDVMVCLYCGSVLMHGGDVLRPVAEEEVKTFPIGIQKSLALSRTAVETFKRKH